MSAVVDYHVVTPAGTPVFTTPELDLARAYLRERAKREPDLLLRLEEVATVRRTIGWTRPRLKLVERAG